MKPPNCRGGQPQFRLSGLGQAPPMRQAAAAGTVFPAAPADAPLRWAGELISIARLSRVTPASSSGGGSPSNQVPFGWRISAELADSLLSAVVIDGRWAPTSLARL